MHRVLAGIWILFVRGIQLADCGDDTNYSREYILDGCRSGKVRDSWFQYHYRFLQGLRRRPGEKSRRTRLW